MGFVIGIADNIEVHPIVRGLILGAVVSVAMAMPSGFWGILTLVAFGIVYGIITDFVATKLS